MSAALREAVDALKWWHSIDLGDGVVTKGTKSLETMEFEIANTFAPLGDITGKSVLDAGAFNGGFSIAAKRRGAGRVVALDSWRSGIARTAFDLAVKASGLDIKPAQMDVRRTGHLGALGPFDIVLFLGVFYHLRDPLGVTQVLARMAKEAMVIETAAAGYERTDPVMHFIPGSDRPHAGDNNWWAPNAACLEAILRNCGFARTQTKQLNQKRIVTHAWKEAT